MGRDKREKSKSGSVLGALVGWILYIAIIIGLALLIITFVADIPWRRRFRMETN